MTAPQTAPSFADWQWSRGIMPWTLVHEWDEVAFRRRLLKIHMAGMARRLGEPLVEAMQKMAAILASTSDSISRFIAAGGVGGAWQLEEDDA